ncbi:MAG: FadR family transcriptional regulator [Alphaproteobacteria bacterium]|nr:FadR family transcriptional regulator [Alphaproteobacteria bacterium]
MTTFAASERQDEGLLSERVAGHLRRLIDQGVLASGERLPGERQLAESLKVSRVSVRAALQSLKAEGYLEARQGGGTKVLSSARTLESPLAGLVRRSPANLRDLVELRILLEGWAASRAAQRRDVEALHAMEMAVRSMEGDLKRKRSVADDLAFHKALAKGAGSAVYDHVHAVVGDVMAEMVKHLRQNVYESPEEAKRLAHQHREILEAVQDGNAALARNLLEKHLGQVIDTRGASK